MKKSLAILLALALMLPLCACIKNDAAPTPAPLAPPSAPPTPTPAPTPAPEPTSDPAALKDAETERLVAEYCELMRPDILQGREAYAQAGLSLDALSEGKDFIVLYRYLIAGMSPSSVRASIEAQGELFKELYYELADYADDDSVRVIVRCIASNGASLMELIVDKAFEPAESGGALDPEGYASLEELIESDFFAAQFESGTGEYTASAETEGENILIIKHTISRKLSSGRERQFKADWEASFIKNGRTITNAMLLFVESAVRGIDAQKLCVIYRLYSFDGRLLCEYKAYELQNEA